jgi:hypothetical protein
VLAARTELTVSSAAQTWLNLLATSIIVGATVGRALIALGVPWLVALPVMWVAAGTLRRWAEGGPAGPRTRERIEP